MKKIACLALIAVMTISTSQAAFAYSNTKTKVGEPIKVSSTVKNKNYNNVIANKQKVNKTNIKIEKKIKKGKNSYAMYNLNFPVIKGMKDVKIQRKLNSMFEKSAMDLKKEIVEKAKEDYKYSKKEGMKFIPYEVYASYKVTSNKDGFLSLYIDYYIYTGGVHGVTNRVAYNIDLKTGKALTLKDIFGKNPNYKNIINSFIQQEISKEPDKYFDKKFQGITDEQVFAIKDNKLVVYFQQYELAPYAYGILSFEIPLSNLEK